MENSDTLENLHQQTAKIEWQELQRFFAQGLLLKVDQKQDLVKVANLFTKDDKQEVSKLLEGEQVTRCSDDDARKWQKSSQILWAVVVAPWVLVQEIQDKESNSIG